MEPVSALGETQVVRNQWSRLDQRQEEIAQALSEITSVPLEKIEDLLSQLSVLSESDKRQILSQLKRSFKDDKNDQLNKLVDCYKDKTIAILCIVTALLQCSSATSLLSRTACTATAGGINALTPSGVSFLTVGHFAGHAFLQLPAELDKASELCYRALSASAQMSESIRSLPQSRNEASKTQHQAGKDALAQEENTLSNDISQASSHRDAYLQMIQKKVQELHDFFLAFIR